MRPTLAVNPAPAVLLAILVAGPVAAQVPPDRAEAPAPWALREEFDPDAIPGFAAWFQRSVDRVMEDAVERGVTPGAYVVVGHGGEVVLSRGYGWVDRVPGSPRVDDRTLWDLASVTKVAATTLSAMVLVEDGRLELDAPVARYLEGWPAEGLHGRITLRHLLSHTSGLPGALPSERTPETRQRWIEALASISLAAPPGEGEIYSDLGPILAGFVVEAVTGETLERFADRRIFRPLELHQTMFRPLDRGFPVHDIAPTAVLARGPLRGVVHDPSARAMGGVAGNAGLFATARDLTRLASAILWEDPARITCRRVIEEFTTRDGDEPRFGVGWEMPSRGGVWTEVFSPAAFGHTGFTGTSLWIDPEQDLFVILLTSRLNAPSSADEGHVELRRELHDVVGRAHTDDEAADMEADWRVPRTWRGVDGCRAEAALAAVARLESSALAPLTW